MPRRVFFSFHYERDIWRVSQVRNSWVTQDRDTAGFWDSAAWEDVKRGGEKAIERWIEDQLHGTSVTVVLIGAETSSRKFVTHEIQRSCVLGKGLVGVRIHGLKGREGYADRPGTNPLDQLGYDRAGGRQFLSGIYRTYDYATDGGYTNMNRWIEEAALAAGR